MEQITLFDVDKKPIKIVFHSKYQKWKYENNYRKADYMSDRRCRNCIHLLINLRNYITGGRDYYKCELLGCSSSSATDVRLSNVCDLFEMNYKEQQ